MNYIFAFNARVKEGDPFEEKHHSFINFLKSLDGEWGILPDTDCPFPKYSKADFSAIFSFYRKFRGKIKGISIYSLRNKLSETHSSDDRIFLEFNSKNIN